MMSDALRRKLLQLPETTKGLEQCREMLLRFAAAVKILNDRRPDLIPEEVLSELRNGFEAWKRDTATELQAMGFTEKALPFTAEGLDRLVRAIEADPEKVTDLQELIELARGFVEREHVKQHVSRAVDRKGTSNTDVEVVRQAIARLGAGAKPVQIEQSCSLQKKKVRDILRQLENAGEYNGFARRRPTRY